MLVVDEKVIRARAIRALPDDESWVQDEVAKIVATPWNFNPKKEEQEGDPESGGHGCVREGA